MKASLRQCVGSLLLLAVMLCGLFLPATAGSIPAEAASAPITISQTSPAIPVNAGETVDLTNYCLQISSLAVIGPNGLTWSSDAVTVEEGSRVTPPAAGVYPLSVTNGSVTRTVYLVAKEPSDTEYVLYETDFADASAIENWTRIQQTSGASYSVTGGKLVMDASDSTSSYVRLMMPDYLGDFGDYHLEATGTITKMQNEKRYLALMFRIQKNDYPYYQMCVRQNATLSNGTEFAERTSDNKWNVTHTASYTEKLSATKEYTFAVDAYGNAVSTSINGERLIYAATATKYTKGALGLQVNGCRATFTSVKVTLRTEEVEPTPTKLAEVRDPESNLNQTPSVVPYVNTVEDLKTILTDSPATAVLRVNSALDVVDANDIKIATVAEAMKALNMQVMPAFRVEDEAAVKALCAYLEKEDMMDVFIMSDDDALIRLARDTYGIARGIVDFSARTGVEKMAMSEIREIANTAGARIAVIPAQLATQENVEALQRLFTTVWVQSSAQADTVELVSHITSGANGIITQDRAELERCFTAYFKENTLTRVINIIGHRGQPSTGQENSIASSVDAYQSGETMVENDIYITTDGVIVIMHDITIDRTTNGSGNVESMPSTVLGQYVIDGNTAAATQPIPTLEDYFKEFQGKDIQIVIELKSDKTKIIEPLAELIHQYDIADQVNIITFEYQQIAALKQHLPEVSVGYLTSEITLSEEDYLLTVEEILQKVQQYDTTYNPSYASGALGPNVMTAASHRGVTLWPWTINKTEDFDTYFLYGVHGITTNYSSYVSRYIKNVTTEQSGYEIAVGEEIELPVIRTNYDRTQTASTVASMTVISGNADAISYKNGKLAATETGEYSVIFGHACRLSNGKTYYMYSQPVTVSVVDVEAPVETVTTVPVQTEPSAETQPSETSGDGTSIPTPVIVVVIVCTVVGLTAGVVFAAIKKKS